MNSSSITSGNTLADGAPFQFWFLGDFASWTKGKPDFARADFALRQSNVVEMKWGVHRAGETRVHWAPCSDKTTISILVRGKFLLRFRAPNARDEIAERRLICEGDYAIWGTDVEHTWIVEEDAVIFTARWIER